jgi:hypothetical protein
MMARITEREIRRKCGFFTLVIMRQGMRSDTALNLPGPEKECNDGAVHETDSRE